MMKFFNKSYVLAAISGVLTGIAVLYVVFPLAWICWIPLFMIFIRKNDRGTIWTGAIFGIAVSLVTFIPLISGVSTFTGAGFGFGLIVLIIASLVYALLFGIIIFVIQQVLRLVTESTVFRGLAVASTWIVVEFLLYIPLDGMPWFGGHMGNGLAGNYYAIQTAELFGDHGLAFIMVFVNYMLAESLTPFKLRKMILPVLLIGAWLGVGAIIEMRFQQSTEPSQKPFRLAILSENTPPEIKWEEQGNALVSQFLELNKTAVSMNPDMILWSESAIPWTYEVNDDFVREIRKVSDPMGITQLLGINTDFDGVRVNNSLYCLSPEKDLVERYDKNNALDFIEKPIAGILLPFFNENATIMVEGEKPVPLNTAYGKAGVMICSESFLRKAASKMVKNGAEFFVQPGNDGWYRNTPIVRQHFFVTRLRAVETRKDIAVNSNLGISGLIQASGKIAKSKQETMPYVDIVLVSPNKHRTFYTEHPFLWIYLSVFFFLCSVGFGSKLYILKKIKS